MKRRNSSDLLQRYFSPRHSMSFSPLVFQFATLVRRACYAEVGPFNEALVRSQDYEMALRLLRRFEARFVDAPVFLQREHAGTRGSGSDRFAAAQNMSRWAQYDRTVFAQLRPLVADDEYLPRPLAHLQGALRQRAALLQKSCIYARREMWDGAIEDLGAAVRAGGPEPISAAEEAIAGRWLLGKHGCRRLACEPELALRIARACAGSAFGHSVLTGLGRPLIWRARAAATTGLMTECRGYLAALVRLSGMRGLAAAVSYSTRRRVLRA